MAVLQKTRTNSGISPYTGQWTSAEVLHLLRRVHLGVKKEDLNYFMGRTMNQAVDEILNIDYTVPAPPINNYNAQENDPNIPAGQTWVDDFNGQLNNVRRTSFKAWWIGEMINHDRTIREKLVLFWHNHFATESMVINWPNFVYRQNALIRANCAKNFKTLVKDMTVDAGMLIYLNGERNTKTAPDENYSRELQELFTLGKGPDSQYTEGDVQEGARVLTGWRVNRSNGTVYFDTNRHDETDKTFSSFFGNATLTGKSGAAGAEETNDLIDMIFLEDEVSKFIVRKLYRHFVYYEIDAGTEADVISPLATIFRNNSYEIKPVLEALFKSEHFFDVANRGALIKPPTDFALGMARQYDFQFPDPSNYAELYDFWSVMRYLCATMSQDIGDPPNVAGWPAYYQLPQFHELWISADTLVVRNQVSDIFSTYGYTRNGFNVKIDGPEFAKKFTNVADPDLFLDELLEFLHTLPVTSDQKGFMKSWLLSGQVENHYWTDAWNDWFNDQSNPTKHSVVQNKLGNLLKYMMNLSEYQLS